MSIISTVPALFTAPDNRSGQMACSSLSLIQHCLWSQVSDSLETFYLSFITCLFNSRYRLHMNIISTAPALFTAPDNRSGQMTCSSLSLIQHCLWSQVSDSLETFYLSFITCLFNSRYRLHMNIISTAPALFTAPDNRSGQMACNSLSLIQHCLWSQVSDGLETSI